LSRRDRITMPEDMSQLARESTGELAASASDVQPVVALSAVPWLVVTYEKLRSLPLDSRAGFVVSLIDGRCTVEMILDLSGMPEDETVDVLRQLLGVGAIELRGR
jgi:hypothetical protein